MLSIYLLLMFKFQREVTLHPEILLNKINLDVVVTTTIPDCGRVIRRKMTEVSEIYTTHATSYDHLPAHRRALLVLGIAPSATPHAVLNNMPLHLWEIMVLHSIAATGDDTPLPYVVNCGGEQILAALERVRTRQNLGV
jgi:hypothetical protein